LREKWYVRGFIKMHIVVDKESKEIVATRVTKETYEKINPHLNFSDV